MNDFGWKIKWNEFVWSKRIFSIFMFRMIC